MRYAVVLFLVAACWVWVERKSIARGWRARLIFPSHLYWGLAALYILSGSGIGLSAFGAIDLGLRPIELPGQALAIASLASMVVVPIVAYRRASPFIAARQISQRNRTEILAFWWIYFLAGIPLGMLPTLLSAR